MSKILVVEDMPDSAELAAQILRRYGHEVVIAATGEDGLILANKYRPDLIVYDYWLPDIDARSFLTRLRAMAGLEHTPVLACTATPASAIQPGLGADGFSGLLHKPYRLSSFMEAVDAQLG
ncbi:MAG: response regulator [Anaerolineales bacterium]|nr:response regulator [Anaerolineales bacterium]